MVRGCRRMVEGLILEARHTPTFRIHLLLMQSSVASVLHSQYFAGV